MIAGVLDHLDMQDHILVAQIITLQVAEDTLGQYHLEVGHTEESHMIGDHIPGLFMVQGAGAGAGTHTIIAVAVEAQPRTLDKLYLQSGYISGQASLYCVIIVSCFLFQTLSLLYVYYVL